MTDCWIINFNYFDSTSNVFQKIFENLTKSLNLCYAIFKRKDKQTNKQTKPNLLNTFKLLHVIQTLILNFGISKS